MAALLASVACDDLTLPPGPDAGPPSSSSSSGGNPGDPGIAYVPKDAKVGEVVSALGTKLTNWATVDTAGKVNTMNWNLPLAAVGALDGAKFDARVWLNVHPDVMRDTAVTGIGIDYLAVGHIPNGVYNVAHWEFHVVLQDFEDVKKIDCTDPTLPANEIIPQGWFVLPPPDNCFASMGIHAISMAAPEFNGQRFTFSNLLVYYRGNGKLKDVGTKLVSFEPKATVQLLKERKSFTIPFPTLPPNTIGRAATVPTTLQATYDSANDVYIITAGGFTSAT